MKIKILLTGILKITALNVLILISVCSVCTGQPPTQEPDGWRYATQEDADYWENVSLGDVLLFGIIDPNNGIRYIPQNHANGPINIQGGNKIHIWQGNYGVIRIEVLEGNNGSFVETNSSEQNPVVITNLGGQVQFGAFGRYRSLGNMNIQRFKHVFVTGEYDQVLGTGDENYRGLDGDLTAHGWINRFGIMGDRKYSTMDGPYADPAPGLGLTINSFLSAKVRGVAVLRGFFAGFSVKSDNIQIGHHTTIDIQKCLSGWHTNEGFYVGSTQPADSYPDNKVIFKNNVVLFTGGDGLQLDKLSSGTEIMNNFMYKSACFYQYPHEGGFIHDNTLQLSFVQGNVRTEDNIMYGGSAGKILNNFVLIPKSGVSVQPSEITLSNNLFGPSRARFGFIASSDAADANGVVDFRIENNFIDFMPVICSNDVEDPIRQFNEWIRIDSRISPYYLTNNVFPEGDKDLYNSSATTVIESNTTLGPVPPLLLHSNFGFDPAEILKFRGVWLTGEYGTTADSEGPITYNEGDMVFTVKENKTRYYRCIQTHSVVKSPLVETSYWQQMTWTGQDEPTYTPLLQSGSVYQTRGMGLEYSAPPPPSEQSTTWNSYDINISPNPAEQGAIMSDQGTKAVVEFYESTDDFGVTKGSLFSSHNPGTHPHSESHATNWWRVDASSNYPFAGLSTVGRGSDTGETNAPAPSGAIDLQLHPPFTDKLAVAAFIVPKAGTYEISKLAARRVSAEPTTGGTIRFQVFDQNKVKIAELVASNNQLWVTSSSTIVLENLAVNDRIYFATARDGNYAFDFTEISWTVTHVPSEISSWNSYDMTISSNPAEQGAIMSDQGTKAVVEFYESTDDFGVTKGSLFSYHTAGTHPHSESNATNWWRVSETSSNSPFAGLSTVARGSDVGETNAPLPLDVIDLQLHPPINDKLAVAAFIVPNAGTYEISKLAARRVSALPTTGGTIRFQVFDNNKVKKAEIVASNNQIWVTSTSIIVLENLAVNDRIYFATARDGNYAFDFTEISWTVTHVPSGGSAAARTASILENDLITAVSEEENLGVYPNPVENVMYVKGLPGKETNVKIYNSQGMELVQENISSENGSMELEVGGYRPGIYFMILQSGREMKRYKFLKK